MPERFRSTSVDNFESQGVRILIDNEDTPSADDIETALQLCNCVWPHLAGVDKICD